MLLKSPAGNIAGAGRCETIQSNRGRRDPFETRRKIMAWSWFGSLRLLPSFGRRTSEIVVAITETFQKSNIGRFSSAIRNYRSLVSPSERRCKSAALGPDVRRSEHRQHAPIRVAYCRNMVSRLHSSLTMAGESRC